MPTLYNFYGRPRHTLYLPPNFQFAPESEDIPANPILLDDIYAAQGYLNGDLSIEQMIAFGIFPADWSDERRNAVLETGVDPEAALAAAEADGLTPAPGPGPDDGAESDDGAGADDDQKEPTRRTRK